MSTKRKLVIVDDDFHSHTFDGDPQIELIKWRGVKKPTGLRGFATVDFHGLVLPNMPVMITADGDRWVGLPGRRLLRWARDEEPFVRAVVAAVIAKYGQRAMSAEPDKTIEAPTVGIEVAFDHPAMGPLNGTIARVRVPTSRLMTKSYPADGEAPSPEEVVKDYDECSIVTSYDLTKVVVETFPDGVRHRRKTFDVWQRHLRPVEPTVH
jgi:hypothetical protein